MKSRSRQLLEKSIGAMIAAVEIYNKPSFSYREETFAILAINAWELLLKARLLQLNDNKVGTIFELEKRRTKTGALSKKQYRKRSRSGNYVSIGLLKSVDLLKNEYRDTVPPGVRLNLEALVEVRNNAIHLTNTDASIAMAVHGLGCAALKNYVLLVRRWFGDALDIYNWFLTPIGFLGAPSSSAGIVLNKEEQKFLDFIEETKKKSTAVDAEFAPVIEVDIRFRRASSAEWESGSVAVISGDGVRVSLAEEDVRDKYPWTYDILTSKLKKRYVNFSANGGYHSVRKRLELDSQFCNVRYLDPGNPKSTKKKFYSPNIVEEFDKVYGRKRVESGAL